MENNEILIEKRNKILIGLEKAYEKLVEFKKSKNSPLVVSRNGKILELNPDEVPPVTTYKSDA
jgi:hypothetical protein